MDDKQKIPHNLAITVGNPAAKCQRDSGAGTVINILFSANYLFTPFVVVFQFYYSVRQLRITCQIKVWKKGFTTSGFPFLLINRLKCSSFLRDVK